MNQNIRKRMISILLTLTMVLGMLPAVTLQAKAAYPDPFTASVNTTTVLGTIADLSGVNLADYSNYGMYVFGVTQPINGQGIYAELGIFNPGDLGYLPPEEDEPSDIPDVLDSICFRATIGGIYTFVLTVGGYSDAYHLLSQRTITVEVSDPNAPPTPFYIGNAMHFADGNDSLSIPYQLTTATDNITMETWVKADTEVSPGKLIRIMYNGSSGPNGYGIYLDGGTRAVMILLGSVGFLGAVTPVYLPAGQWCHLAVVRDAGIWKLYVNGEEKQVASNLLTPNVPGGIFSIGNSPEPNENFIGCIDESRFWGVARSAQQIRDNMYIKLKGTETGLLAYYNYDQLGVVPNGDNHLVTSVKNVKTGGADLTISGFNLYGETSNFVPSVNLGAFQLGSTSYSVSKGQEKVSVAINRTGGSEGTVVINYATANGSALAGSNYTSTSGSLTFASGEIAKTVDIPILANTTGKELTFTFSISAQQGVSFGSNAATIYLANRAGLNHLPVASSVQINSAMYVGNIVDGDYVYSDADGDAEGTSEYRWYRSDDQDGKGKTAISGATSATYQLQPVDLGKYISFEVTPEETDGTQGSTVESSRIVAVDATAPTVTEIAGNPDSWTNRDVTLTVTASDSASGLNTDGAYSFNGGSWTTSNSQTFNSNQTVNIRVRDNSGNIAQQNVVINKIDKAVPTGEITDGTNHWNSFLNAITFGVFFKETASVSISGNDMDGSGIKSVQYYKSDRELTLAETQALTEWRDYTSTLSLTPTNAEKFIIYAKITDNAGNVTLISSDGMEFDMQGPSISTNYTKDASSMEVSVEDSGSGIKNVTYKIDGGALQSAVLSSGKFSISLPEGKYDVVIFAEDTAGNTNSLTVNVVSLHTVIFMLFDGYTGEALKTETVEYSSTATAPANPTRTGFSFKNWDKAFSCITADTVVNATWDISGITVTPYIDTYDGAAHNAVSVSGTLPGDIITYSIDGIDYSSSCPQYTNAESYPVFVKVERTGYTAWESGLKTAVISRAEGSITFTSDPSKVYNGQPAPIPIVSKNSSGAVNYTYYSDNAGVMGAALPNAPVAAGIYWIKASMEQDTNYTAAEVSIKYMISRAEITGSIAIPTLVKNGDTVSVTPGDAFPGDMTIDYEWRLNGSAIPGETGSSYLVKLSDYGKSLSAAIIGNGNYTGTVISNAVTVTETVKPTGEISDGTNRWNSFLNTITFGLFFKETVNITIDSSDDGGSGINNVQYYKSADVLTLAEVQALTEWSNYTSALPLTPTDAEKLIIYAKITDNAGNVTFISSDGMEFDLQGPTISTNYKKDASSMEVTAIDSGSGIKAITYTVNGGAAQTAALTNDKFTVSLPEGKYPVVVTAKDSLGNENSLTVNVVSLYIVTFKLFDGYTGEALKTETVEYGNTAAAPDNPIRTGFLFKNWDKAFSNIKADTMVNAAWDISGISAMPYIDTYDGAAHNDVTVSGTLPGDVITYSINGTDYSALCPQHTNVGSYPVYVKVERPGYTAWQSTVNTAVIGTKDITSDMITNIPSSEYTGQAIKPLPEVKLGSIVLTKDADYTVIYSDNTDIGIASVTISGNSNYSGSVTKKFAIYAKNTGVEIEGQETPPVIAEGLETLYEDESVYTEEDRQIEQNGGTVKIELSVQVKSDLTDDKKKIEEIASDKSIGLYLDLSLYKTVTMTGENNGTTTRISHLNDLLTIEIPIPENIKDKKGIVLYRVHEGTASTIPVGQENAAEGEYCVINAETITLYVRNFSTYAIGFAKAVDDVKKPETGDHSNSLPIVASAISLTAVIALLLNRKRRTKSK